MGIGSRARGLSSLLDKCGSIGGPGKGPESNKASQVLTLARLWPKTYMQNDLRNPFLWTTGLGYEHTPSGDAFKPSRLIILRSFRKM